MAKGTVETQIKNAEQSLINAITENSLKKTEINLNKEKIKQIANSIEQEWVKVRISGEQLDINKLAQQYSQEYGIGINPMSSTLRNIDLMIKGWFNVKDKYEK